MIKLFAILAVLAATLPVSALAGQNRVTPAEGIDCAKDGQDVQYGVQQEVKAEVKKAGDAHSAN